MKLICNIFKNGSRTIRQQTDDGDLVGYLEGEPNRPVRVRRIIAYIEVVFSEPEATAEEVLGALDQMKKLVSERVRHTASAK